MQLRGIVLLVLLIWGGRSLSAQSDSLPPAEPVDIHILFNYYEQDGNNAAVTGGTGSQELTDLDGKIVVHVPFDSASALTVNTRLNQYTSASTDRIDSRLSSASMKDNRASIQGKYERRNEQKRTSREVGGGGSIESDYISMNILLAWSKRSKDGNRMLTLGAQVFFDRWIVIFPEELRNDPNTFVDTEKRRSFNFSASFSQVINPRLQVSVHSGLIAQQGLLSTPFHRVYFQNTIQPRIERLPGWRWRFPLALRAHYFAGDFLVFRWFGRGYVDSWGISAATTQLVMPLKIGQSLAVIPEYRFHVQTASRYFQPYAAHEQTADFYTSDYDLSGFTSHQFGVGMRISPVYGLFRLRSGQKRRKIFMLRSLEVKGLLYRRSDGLAAWMINTDFGFRLK